MTFQNMTLHHMTFRYATFFITSEVTARSELRVLRAASMKHAQSPAQESKNVVL